MLMAWSHAFTETAGKLLIGLCCYDFTPRSISFLTSEHFKKIISQTTMNHCATRRDFSLGNICAIIQNFNKKILI